jgi:hypothetical protein
MKFTTKKLSVSTAVKKIKNTSLDLAPEYQRGPVWSSARKALLIDSMLRGYDLPKFYVRLIPAEKEILEVVDGLQRLTSMVDFVNGDFKLPKVSQWAGKKYEDLPEDIAESFDDYQLDFSILEGFSDEDVRDMFLRLQNGLKLNAAEELNAIQGDMHNWVEELSNHSFFKFNAPFSSSRGAHRHVSAQLCRLAIAGYGDVRKKDLMDFYKDYANWEIEAKAKQLRSVLNWLNKVFSESDPALRNRGQTITVVMAAFDLWTEYVLDGHEESFKDTIYAFDKDIIAGRIDFKDYANAISHSSDQGISIELRREFMLAVLKEFKETLVRRDPKRTFTLPDRVLAWYNANGQCEHPGCGEKLTYQSFHADHKTAWSKGGESKLHNLQVLCPAHNLSKGAK